MSTGSNGLVQVSIGNGDGTFKAPVQSTFRGEVLATGDFNGDSRPDVVAARRTFQETVFVILPGNGTATLGNAVTVVSTGQIDFTFALGGDLNGDGKRDLVLSSLAGVNVYPGNGNFTFNAPIELVTNGSARDGIVADLNKDGRLDVVTANAETGTISIFLNKGGNLFSPSDLHSAHNTNDVTVADVDHDGSPDLLIAAGNPETDSSIGDGFVLVFHGKGDGTFPRPWSIRCLEGRCRSSSATSTATACWMWSPATGRASDATTAQRRSRRGTASPSWRGRPTAHLPPHGISPSATRA